MMAALISFGVVALYLAVARAAARIGSPALLNPVALTALLIWFPVKMQNIPLPRFDALTAPLHWLLGPAVVALGAGLASVLRSGGRAALLSVAVGAAAGSLSGILLGRALGLPGILVQALSVKSVSTPFALLIMERTGGAAALASGLVIATGVLSAVLVLPALKLFGFHDATCRGLAAGVSGHIIATANLTTREPAAAAAAAYGMALCGAMTAFVLPIVWNR